MNDRSQKEKGGRWILLTDYCAEPLQAESFLELAVAIAAAVAELHRERIIHLALTPQQIRIDRSGGSLEVRLQPQRALRENGPTPSLGGLDPAYISPEQTGRIQRPIDHRSDLYSLGILYYRLLTGRLPFEGQCLLEWVHWHIARLPRPPRELRPELPQTLSDLVMKLLAKTPEERYQSAAALKADLEKCLRGLRENGIVEPFPLGEDDVPDQLVFPAKLYGKEAQSAVLKKSFERMLATGSPQLVLVSGEPGVGKTSLVHAAHLQTLRAGALFVSGKAVRREIPYSGLVEALRDLVRQLLTDQEEKVALRRRRILDALGSGAGLLVELIPELESVIGPQPKAPEFSPKESENRFRLLFRQFLEALADKERPLVLFLDDLHLAAPATLSLLDRLTTPGPLYLLLVAAYRTNGLGREDPLPLAIEALKEKRAGLETVTVPPFSLQALSRFLGETFHCDPAHTLRLSEILLDKSGGNPFFTTQLLRSLYEEGLVRLDPATRCWRWDIEAIRSRGYAENVADLMVAKLRRLPAATREQLGLAALVGHRFDVPTLAAVSGAAESELVRALEMAEREGLLLREGADFLFLHDRIREAAQSLIPSRTRGELHLKIATRLLGWLTPEQAEQRLFEVLFHLNRGSELIREPAKRMEAARLNLRAAVKARESIDYESALDYLATAERLSGENAWSREYRLSFEISLERAHCSFLRGEAFHAEKLLRQLLEKAGSRLDRARTYRLLVDLLTIKGDDEAAVESAVTCLKEFDIELPRHPSREAVDLCYRDLLATLGSRSIDKLIELPLMEDRELESALEVLVRVYAPAYHLDNDLFYLHLCQGVRLSLAHGNSPAAVHFYGWFGIVLSCVFGRSAEGAGFVKLGFDLMQRHRFESYRAKALFALRIISYWTDSADRMIQYSRATFQAAVETGDVAVACYTANHTCFGMLIRGDHLLDVRSETERALEFTAKAGCADVSDMILTVRRAVDSLAGKTLQLGSLDGEGFDESRFERELQDRRMPTLHLYYYTIKLIARFTAGRYREALAAAEKGEEFLWSGLFSPQAESSRFYGALTQAALWDRFSPQKRQEALEVLRAERELLARWVKVYPGTFGTWLLIVDAELARIAGELEGAMRLYDEAIRSAAEREHLPEEALAWELAERFYRAKGLTFIADGYLEKARVCYLRWGAQGKASQLAERLERAPEKGAPQVMENEAVGRIDAITVVRACQAISEETGVADLLTTLIRTVMQNAGASRVVLLLGEKELLIRAEGRVTEGEIQVSQQETPPDPASLPVALVNYVTRTRQNVILPEGAAEGLFSADGYLAAKRPASVMCIPILREGTPVGALYLENDLLKGAFSHERLVILELIAAQAVISLENARAAERFRELLESAPDAMVIVDGEGRIRIVNAQMEKMFGYPREELIGEMIEKLIPERFRAVHPAHRNRYLTQPVFRPMGMEGTFFGRRKDGREFPVDISLSPLTTPDGVWVTAAIRDATQRRRAEESLKESELRYRQLSENLEIRVQEAVAELRRKDQLLVVQGRQAIMGEMIGNIAHQWRQPLNILGLLAQELRMTYRQGEFDDAFVEANVKKTMAILQHMSKTIDDFRNFFRPEKEKVRFRVRDSVERTLSLMEGTLKAAQVRVEVTASADPVALGYPNEFSQALINILTNSRDAFVSEKIEEPHIRIELSTEGEKGVVVITDNAGGIPDEILDKIFLPYFTTKGPDKGTGLGLFMSKTIIENNMNGTLKASNWEKGARFRIEL